VKSSYLREPRVDKDLWGWVLSQKHRPGLKDFESKQWAQHNPKGARQVRTALEFHLAVRQAMVEELKGMNPEKPTTDCETLARDRVRTLPMFRDVADADLNLWDILLTTVKSFVSSKLFPLPDDGRYTIENFVVGREELAASSPSELVRDLELRAKPFMFIEDSTLKDPPLQKDFLTVDQPSTSFFQGQSDDPDGLRVFASYDPFSIGCVRTVHGLSLEAMGSLRRYHRTFQRLDEFDRKQLMAMNVHCYEIEETEDRLPSVLSPCASTSRIA
jgi:hypothetical protein